MFRVTRERRISLNIFCLFIALSASAQYDAPLYTSYTTNSARELLHQRLIKNTITKNFAVPLSDSTEENWMEAFNGLQLIVYKTPETEEKIKLALEDLRNRSDEFRQAFLETIFALYPSRYKRDISVLLTITRDFKTFALSAEYLLAAHALPLEIKQYEFLLKEKFDTLSYQPAFLILQQRLQQAISGNVFMTPSELRYALSNSFLPGNLIMYSFQRKNRDYPGLVMVRNGAGKFSTDSSGHLFHAQQLARSINNLPFYFKGGNTPQGLFLMYGFGVSLSRFIGPSANVQMGMPVELSVAKFLRDSAILDSIWNIKHYQQLLPRTLANSLALYESFYAGSIGRNEIIAHGTAIDPEYYEHQPYYPLTPSLGCLCTKEIWNGNRISSDQQKLVNALLQAGGAQGYCLVIELDDKQAPVTISDLKAFLPK